MKIVYTALMAIIFFAACDTEIAEPSHTQLPDDPEQLKTLLSEEKDQKVKLDICYALFIAYRESNTDLASYYLNSLEDLAVELGDDLTAGKACYNMGLLYDDIGGHLSAVDSYLKAVNHFKHVNDIPKIGSVLNNLGVVFMETGNYEYARKFYIKTRDIHLQTNDTRRLVLTYLNLGICNFLLIDPNYDSAKNNLVEALRLAETLDDKREYYLNRIHTQMGTMYYKSNQFDAAIDSYLLSLQYLKSGDIIHEQKAIGYANIGEVYMGQGEYEEARKWLDQALALSGQIKDANRKIGIYNITGRLYQAEGKHLDAVEYFENAINIADKETINEPLQETLHLIRESYVQLRKINRPVALARYENVLIVDDIQDKLEEDLVEKANFKALQAALGMVIELDHQKKEKQAQVELKSLFISIAVLLAVAAIFIGYKLRSTKFELNQAGNRLRLIKHIAKH